MDFWKLQGAGNDFILIDNRDRKMEDLSALARFACHRRFGVGADGLMAAELSETADIRMVYFNTDGSPAAMCGNGIRCFSKFVRDRGILAFDRFTVETGDGIKHVEITSQDEITSVVKVDMGKASDIRPVELSIKGETYKSIFMQMGVPHAVLFPDQPQSDPEDPILETLNAYAESLGPCMEKAPVFPEGANINFVKIQDQTRLTVSTWERGAGRTLACGTGATASAAAAHMLGLAGPAVRVRMQGGEVTVEIAADGALSMEGPATLVCRGSLFPGY